MQTAVIKRNSPASIQHNNALPITPYHRQMLPFFLVAPVFTSSWLPGFLLQALIGNPFVSVLDLAFRILRPQHVSEIGHMGCPAGRRAVASPGRMGCRTKMPGKKQLHSVCDVPASQPWPPLSRRCVENCRAPSNAPAPLLSSVDSIRNTLHRLLEPWAGLRKKDGKRPRAEEVSPHNCH